MYLLCLKIIVWNSKIDESGREKGTKILKLVQQAMTL